MAETIRKNIEFIRDEVSHPTLNRIQILAMRLAASVTNTADWDEFLRFFADPEEGVTQERQLRRLRREDSAGTDFSVTRALVYLFANSVCGGSTGARLLENVGDTLDIGLQGNSIPAHEETLRARIAADDARMAAEVLAAAEKEGKK
jgi:hypothetical protein